MRILAPSTLPLLDVLAILAPESSKTTLRSWVEQGRVLIEGAKVKKTQLIVSQGQEVCVGPRKQFAPEGIEILYEDREFIVIHKPEGLLSVDTVFEKQLSAHTILKRRFSQTVHPVHRLDRETSGVMVFAYSERAKEHFKEIFYHHDIEREYIALVEGVPSTPSGTWQSYLVEDPTYVVRSTSSSEGRLAITHYEILKAGKRSALLRLRLETGRKNQIRVHCKEAGHPIVGDIKYGAQTNSIGRVALHAHKLGFVHPVTKKKLSFQVPFPESFMKNAER